MRIGKKASFLGRQKYRFGRGQGYISIVNTMILLGLAFNVNNQIIIIGIAAGTLLCVWAIGMADDRFRIVHAESNHNIESTTPYFQEMKADMKEIKGLLAGSLKISDMNGYTDTLGGIIIPPEDWKKIRNL